MSVLLGCVADDFTGASDLASFLVESGMSTVQIIDVPASDQLLMDDVDAVVVALKSRTQPVSEAIKDSIAALEWLKAKGCQQFYFKYCSTFDSTTKGNIGPVVDAMLDNLGERYTIACPSLPVNGRTVFNGHLFVNGELLNESGMEFHPLTPMTDSNIVRVMAQQSQGKVSLIDHAVVEAGPEAIKEAMKTFSENSRYSVVDAVSNENLMAIAHASEDLKLITGGSGLSIGLADNYVKKGLFEKRYDSKALRPVEGGTVILSGSCSAMTRAQVAHYKEKNPSLKINPMELEHQSQTIEEAVNWYQSASLQGRIPVLIYATDEPENINKYKHVLGEQKASQLVEDFMYELANALSRRGVCRFIVAGGETSGSVVKALKVTSLKIGESIAPGVPVVQSTEAPYFLLALKSGNFGQVDFFDRAFQILDEI
ncbi:3-oxo-tetronate kinase [Idiomarina abyssalis]|uniref:3-oxo-tetronate kinase n=1 Tax=Idiomarina abyssalis TaxID=86102 RepID=UPI003A94434C